MNEAALVLQSIHDELAERSPEETGRLALADDALALLDLETKLTVVVEHDPDSHPAIAHCHVVAAIADERGRLDACVVGIDPARAKGLRDAATTWIETVAPPLLSLLRARPVMGAAHFDGSQPWGVAGCHGFVGPLRARLFEREFTLDENARAFDYAAEMAPPGIVHLAKVTLEAAGKHGWKRNLEVDGHAASHVEQPWDAGTAAPAQGIASQFAIFHYGDQPDRIEARQRVDDAIRRFVAASGTASGPEEAATMLKSEGIDGDLVNRAITFVPLAFGRVIFGSLGPSFPPHYMRIRRDGVVEEGLKLMHEPVFARSMALCSQFMEGGFLEAVKRISVTGPELNAINKALCAGSKPNDLTLSPSIVIEPGVDDAALERALNRLHERAEPPQPTTPTRPWWKLWR